MLPGDEDVPLTLDTAYAAMFFFLENYYRRGPTDEVGNILSNMCLLVDGNTADPAYWHDWKDAVAKALREGRAPLLKLTR